MTKHHDIIIKRKKAEKRAYALNVPHAHAQKMHAHAQTDIITHTQKSSIMQCSAALSWANQGESRKGFRWQSHAQPYVGTSIYTQQPCKNRAKPNFCEKFEKILQKFIKK